MRILSVLFLSSVLAFAYEGEERELTCTYQNVSDVNITVPKGRRVVLCYKGQSKGSLSITGSGEVYLLGLSSDPHKDVLKGDLRLYGNFEKVHVQGLKVQGAIDTQGFKEQVPEEVVLKDVILISHKVSLHSYRELSVISSTISSSAPVYASGSRFSILGSAISVSINQGVYHRHAVQIEADSLNLSGSVIEARSFPSRWSINVRVWHSLQITDSVLLGRALGNDINQGILISVGRRGYYAPLGRVSIVNSVLDGEGSSGGVLLESLSGKLSSLTIFNSFIMGRAREDAAPYNVYLKKPSDVSTLQKLSIKAEGGRQTHIDFGNLSTVKGGQIESTSSVFIRANMSGFENMECVVSGKSLRLEGNLSLCRVFSSSEEEYGVVLFSNLIDRTEVRSSGGIDLLPLRGYVKVYKSTFRIPHRQRVFIEWLSQDSQQNCFEKKLVLSSATYMPSSVLYQWGRVAETCP